MGKLIPKNNKYQAMFEFLPFFFGKIFRTGHVTVCKEQASGDNFNI